MPRAHRGRFEPLDHFVLGHLAILEPVSALGSLHTAKRFIGLAIGVRTRSRSLHLHLARMKTTAVFLSVFFLFLKSGPVHTPWPRLGGGWQSGVYVFLQYGNRIPRLGPSLSDALPGNGRCVCLAARLLRM